MKRQLRHPNGRFKLETPNKISKPEQVRQAVVRLIEFKFAGVVGFSEWVHPLNTVVNCYALTLDGGIQYKFSLNSEGKLIVAEVRDRYWIDLPVEPSDVITWEQLLEIIPKANCRNVFGRNGLSNKELIYG